MFILNSQRVRHVLFITALFATAAAQADDKTGFYIGAGAGAVKQTVDEIEFDQADVSFKLYGGYSINRHVAAEVSYINAGAPNQHYGTANLKVESTGVAVAVLGKLPLGDSVAIFGKVGYAALDRKGKLTDGIESEIIKQDDEDLLYGIGADLYLGNRFTLRAEYEAVDVVDGKFTFASLNGVVRF
jgi:OOP family OmpA-OmpF porin